MTTNRSLECTADAHAFTPAQLAERALYRRAVEAVIWGMPVVNFDVMLQSFIGAGGGPNQVPFWTRLLDSNNQTLTPNPDTIYFNPFFDTREEGPMVLEIPPADTGSITGSIDDCWQNALEDVGPAGFDKGQGGRYLILPPGYAEPLPDGYIPIPCDTYQGFIILRSNVKSGSDEDVAAAVTYGKRIGFYPLSQAGRSPQTRRVDMTGVLFNGTIPYDRRFFRSLARMIDHEPWLTRDKAMIDPLRTLGIGKGIEFAPDAATEAVFDAAAGEAHAILDGGYRDVFNPPFCGHWALPALPEVSEGMPNFFAANDAYPVDGRAVTYSMAYFSAKHIGAGQYYLMTIVDADGNPLDGGATYRLRVPPKAPARLYWSFTAYDRETHALIRGMPRASRASNSPDIAANADGSVDVWFGPTAPAGKKGNWVPTQAGRGFEVLFRIYGPEKAFFDKSWVLPDFEKEGGVPMPPARPDTHGWIGTGTVETRVGSFDFERGYPTARARRDLADLLVLNRAVETFLSLMHGVSWFAVWKGVASAGAGKANQLVIWEQLMDAETLLLTGNTDTVYGMAAIDLKRDGPVVVDIPPMLLGGISDIWQAEIVGIGPTGIDKGKGGKLLLLPPDHEGPVPEGYLIGQATTYRVVLGVRGFQVEGKTDHAVMLMKGAQIYPLKQAAAPPAVTVFNGSRQQIDTIFSETLGFFEDLAELVAYEPDRLAAQDWFRLASIGIERGKPFAPDAARKTLLGEAAQLGGAMARTNSFASQDPARISIPGRRWEWLFIGGSASWDSQGYVNTDRRAAFSYVAIGMSPAMVLKIVGGGSQYYCTYTDSDGDWLDGGRNYRLHYPPDIPVKNFWSVVVYDTESRSQLRNGEHFPSVSSYTGPEFNADGSIDFFFGPEAPAGKASNWIRTAPGKGWFPLLRFYGPLEPFFDQRWKPDDIVKAI